MASIRKPALAPTASSLRSPWPWVGLGFGLLLTVVVWLLVRKVERTRLGALEKAQASAVVLRMERRMQNLAQVLRGAAGYLGRGTLPTRAEWHGYVEGLDLPTTYAGLQGLSFVEWVPSANLAAHRERVRREGFPDYAVTPGGPLGSWSEGAGIILYLEPTDARNQRAFGKDMLADGTRREAMLRARDTGQVVLSDRLTLYQETEADTQPGIVLFAPVYRQGEPLDTVVSRRRALRGWATIPLRMTDFMRATLPLDLNQADIAIYDGFEASPGRLLFDSNAASPVSGSATSQLLKVPGRAWAARISPSPAYYRQIGHAHHWQFLMGGVVISLLLFTVLVSRTGAEARARRLAEVRGEELLATEAQFRALFEKAPFGMAIMDSGSGRFLSVNQRMGDILGYSVEELLVRDFQGLTHPDHLASDLATLQDLLAGKVDQTQKEKRYLHRLGHPVWARLSMVRLPVAPGAPPRHLAIVEDISEARRQAVGLRASEQRFRDLFEWSPDACTVARLADGQVVMANQRWCELTGLSREEVLGQDPARLGAWAHPEERVAALEELQRTRTLVPREIAILHRDGTSKTVLVNARVLTIDGEAVALIMGRDLTDRLQAEEVRRESEARVRAIFEQSPDPITLSRLSDGALVLANQAWCEATGIPLEEALGQNPAALGAWVDPGTRESVLAELRRSGRLFAREIPLVRRDGTTLQMLVTAQVMTLNGEALAMVSGKDITERHRTEAALKESEERFRRVVEGSPVAVFLHREGRFTFLNPAAVRLFKAGCEEDLVGTPVLDRVHPDDLERVRKRIAQGFEQGIRNAVLEQRLLAVDGSCLDAEVQSCPVSYAGQTNLMVFAQDISGRKRAQEALTESEADLARAQAIGRFGSWRAVHAEGGEQWSVSKGLRLIYGYSPDQPITTQTGFDLMHPDDRAPVQAAWQASLDGTGPCQWEHRIIAGGLTKWLAIRVQHLRAEDGRLLESSGIIQDISERKAAAEALLASEARVRLLGDQLADSFLYQMISEPGAAPRFTYLSAGVERLCGLKGEDVVRDPAVLLERVDPALLPGYFEAEEASRAGLRPFAMDLHLRHTDGTWHWFRVRSMPRIQADGSVIWEGIATDVTEQRRNEALLEESEARLRDVVESAGDAIYLNDEEGRIFLCNRAACASTGYTMEALLRLRISDLDSEFVDPKNRQTVRELRLGQRATILARHRRKDGSTFPVEIHLSLLREAGPRQILAVVRDLTERERVAEADTRARKAESLVLMAGGIAHDFNNLFQALQGNLEIIGLRGRDDPALVQPLGRAIGALNRAISLSWKMLDFSGHSFVQLTPLSPGAWLPAYLETLRLEFPPGFLLDLECEPTPWIRADRSKLEQVVKALLDNALEASPAAGATARLRLFVDYGGGPARDPRGVWPLERPGVPATVCLEVADGGPGVPDEKLGLICDPFFTTRDPGRGLGLSAAVGILSAHHAGFQLFNGEGGGLVLRLHFPPGGA